MIPASAGVGRILELFVVVGINSEDFAVALEELAHNVLLVSC